MRITSTSHVPTVFNQPWLAPKTNIFLRRFPEIALKLVHTTETWRSNVVLRERYASTLFTRDISLRGTVWPFANGHRHPGHKTKTVLSIRKRRRREKRREEKRPRYLVHRLRRICRQNAICKSALIYFHRGRTPSETLPAKSESPTPSRENASLRAQIAKFRPRIESSLGDALSREVVN